MMKMKTWSLYSYRGRGMSVFGRERGRKCLWRRQLQIRSGCHFFFAEGAVTVAREGPPRGGEKLGLTDALATGDGCAFCSALIVVRARFTLEHMKFPPLHFEKGVSFRQGCLNRSG